MSNLDSALKQHCVFCPKLKGFTSTGSRAEMATVQFLVDNLSVRKVGDYRILVNYRFHRSDAGGSGSIEIDVLLINKFGVFLIEVKDWSGIIEATDGCWILSGKYERDNVYRALEDKRVIFSSLLRNRAFGINIPVENLIVLFQGKDLFYNLSSYSELSTKVFGLENDLLERISENRAKASISDEDIQRIVSLLNKDHVPNRPQLVHYFSIVNELSPGDLFSAYEAVNNAIESERVRIKEYNLSRLTNEEDEELFKRDAQAIYLMGVHQNILQVKTFFPDIVRPDVFYEVTELPNGKRLDEIIASSNKPFPYGEQMKLLEQLCHALAHAHKNSICHRNLNPETVYVTRGNIIKLADFDFAKINGVKTISRPGQALVDNWYTPNEVIHDSSSATPSSDIYSLGAIWFTLALLPKKGVKPNPEEVGALNLPDEAKKLLKKILSIDATKRPQSAAYLSRELRDLLKAEPK